MKRDVFGFTLGSGVFGEPYVDATSRAYIRTQKIFGFGEDNGGFGCTIVSGQAILETEELEPIETEGGATIEAEGQTTGAAWLRFRDAPFMQQINVDS